MEQLLVVLEKRQDTRRAANCLVCLLTSYLQQYVHVARACDRGSTSLPEHCSTTDVLNLETTRHVVNHSLYQPVVLRIIKHCRIR